MGTLAPYCPLGKVNGFGNCSLAEKKQLPFPCVSTGVCWIPESTTCFCPILPQIPGFYDDVGWFSVETPAIHQIFGLGDFHFWIRDVVHITRTHSGSGRVDWGCACLVKSWDANAKGEQNNTSNLSNFIKGKNWSFPKLVYVIWIMFLFAYETQASITHQFLLCPVVVEILDLQIASSLVANTISRHNVNVEDNYKRSDYDRYHEIHSFWRNPYVTFHWKERPGIHTLAVFWNGIDPTNTWSTSTFTTPRIAKLSIKKKKLAVIDCTCF